MKILYLDKDKYVINKVITNVGWLQNFRDSDEYRTGKCSKFWSKIKFDWAPEYKLKYNKRIFLIKNEAIEFQQNTELKAIQNKILENYKKKPILINIYFFPNNIILFKLDWIFQKKGNNQKNENYLSTSDLINIENLFKTNRHDILDKDQLKIEINRGRKPRRKEFLNISDIFYSLYSDVFKWTRAYSRRRGILKKKKVPSVDPEFNLEFYHIIEPKEIISHSYISRDIKGIITVYPFYNTYYRNECIETLNKLWSKKDRVFNDLQGAYIFNKFCKRNYNFFKERIATTKALIQFNWLRMQSFIRLSAFLRSEILNIIKDSRFLSMLKMIGRRLTWIDDYLLTSYQFIGSIEKLRYSQIDDLIKNCDKKVKNGINYENSLNYFLEFRTRFNQELNNIKQKNIKIAEAMGKIVNL